MLIRVRKDQADALRHIDAPCPRCGYNLRGLIQLAGTVCPECARTWTLGELLPLHDIARRRSIWWMIPLALAPALLEIALFALGHAIEFGETLRNAGITAMALIAFLGMFWVTLVSWSIAEEGSPPHVRDPGAKAGALTLGLLAANAALTLIGLAAAHALLSW